MTWHRTAGGYLSDDGCWFLERGARMTHGCNAWLIWRLATDAEVEQYGVSEHGWPVRTLGSLALCEVANPETAFMDAKLEEGWLADAKGLVERLAA